MIGRGFLSIGVLKNVSDNFGSTVSWWGNFVPRKVNLLLSVGSKALRGVHHGGSFLDNSYIDVPLRR